GLDRPLVRMDVGNLRALEPLEREHTAARVAPVDARDADVGMSREVAVERIGIACLEAVVELLPDLPRELIDQQACIDEVQRTDALLRDARSLVEQREVGFDLS